MTSLKKNLIDVSAGILWRGTCFLIDQKMHGPYEGFWEFPGGKMEPGENPGQALLRELEEELGVTVTTFEFWQKRTHTYPEINVLLHFFHVVEFQGEPCPKEGQIIRWVTIGEALELPFLEADTAILRDIAALLKPHGTKGQINGTIDLRNINSRN